MTDEIPTTDPTGAGAPMPGAQPAPEAPAAGVSGPSTAEAWNDVIARMGDLGVALSAWARSAVDDPQNQQRLSQVRAGVDEMARQADAAFGKVTSTEFGQQVTQTAQQAGEAIGDAAKQVSDAAAPHVKTAFSGIASFFESAATKLDEAIAQPPVAPQQPAPPAPPAQAAPPESPVEPAAPPAPPVPPSSGTPGQ